MKTRKSIEAASIRDEAKSLLTQQQTILDVHRFNHARSDEQMWARIREMTASDSEPISFVTAFRDCVYAGLTPNANVLAMVAKSFDRYLRANGNLSLDAAFSLKSIQRVGHPITKARRDARNAQVNWMVFKKRREAEARGAPISIERAAGEVINELNLSDTEEAIAKRYGDSKFEQKAEAVEKVLSESLGSRK